MTGQALPRVAVSTADAPPPAGTYSQGVLAGGILYISGQTPRGRDGRPCTNAPFATQANLALANLESIATAGGAKLADAAFVTVYLRDPHSKAEEFDELYQQALGVTNVPPARAIVQSDLPRGDIEVTAMIPIRRRESNDDL